MNFHQLLLEVIEYDELCRAKVGRLGEQTVRGLKPITISKNWMQEYKVRYIDVPKSVNKLQHAIVFDGNNVVLYIHDGNQAHFSGDQSTDSVTSFEFNLIFDANKRDEGYLFFIENSNIHVTDQSGLFSNFPTGNFYLAFQILHFQNVFILLFHNRIEQSKLAETCTIGSCFFFHLRDCA